MKIKYINYNDFKHPLLLNVKCNTFKTNIPTWCYTAGHHQSENGWKTKKKKTSINGTVISTGCNNMNGPHGPVMGAHEASLAYNERNQNSPSCVCVCRLLTKFSFSDKIETLKAMQLLQRRQEEKCLSTEERKRKIAKTEVENRSFTALCELGSEKNKAKRPSVAKDHTTALGVVVELSDCPRKSSGMLGGHFLPSIF